MSPADYHITHSKASPAVPVAVLTAVVELPVDLFPPWRLGFPPELMLPLT